VPRKIREYKADLIALGFSENPRRGRGSHRVWKHPRLENIIVIAYEDGEDTPLYLEKQLREAAKQLEE
jgi:predicted RNA binding protein YcfA (HicA-like mRNA interferase family)